MSCQEERVEWHLDIVKLPALFLLPETPGLTVANQQIEGFSGESMSINCSYHHSGENMWCKFGDACLTGSVGLMGGSKVTITNSGPNVFTVTMTELRLQHSGWYYCVRGNLQMPVHLTVTRRPTTSQLLILTLTSHLLVMYDKRMFLFQRLSTLLLAQHKKPPP